MHSCLLHYCDQSKWIPIRSFWAWSFEAVEWKSKETGWIPQGLRNAEEPGGHCELIHHPTTAELQLTNLLPVFKFKFWIYFTSAVKQKRLHLLRWTWRQETKRDAAVSTRGDSLFQQVWTWWQFSTLLPSAQYQGGCAAPCRTKDNEFKLATASEPTFLHFIWESQAQLTTSQELRKIQQRCQETRAGKNMNHPFLLLRFCDTNLRELTGLFLT